MQYVRNLSDSVSTAWNSINPATLSGAIDVMVVQREDGSLVCSPFHVRFGKFSLLRPYEKKVEFRVNGVKQEYSMKLGEGGEAFFVFETTETIPASLQTSPLSSPATSPPMGPLPSESSGLQEPDPLMLDQEPKSRSSTVFDQDSNAALRKHGLLTPQSSPPHYSHAEELQRRPWSGDFTGATNLPDGVRPPGSSDQGSAEGQDGESRTVLSERPPSPPPMTPEDAFARAMTLSKELSAANIPNHVTDSGDLMLDMAGFKGNEEDVFRAEIFARRILSEELNGNYDIGALIGLDEKGNLWIYSSEEAKAAAMNKTTSLAMRPGSAISADAASDPGYHSDGSDITTTAMPPLRGRSESDIGPMHAPTIPITPPGSTAATGNPNKNYAKTLRLTSDQLKALNLKPGENAMSFTVNRSTCHAYMFLWKQETPVVISDIDGTITKSDALGHVLNMIGRDWTHVGVAKLYSDIAANGYNIMYLTSRSVGQSDTTRAYLANIEQDGCRLPRGPTILSPDRTMAALRREIYLRKPHIFKMATLRDIRQLYGPDHKAFYAGFGNRFTDQISYRTVDVPRTRIFTINSNAEVSLDLLSLNKLKMSYMNINEVVDHYFPPVGTLVKGGGEDFTDFTYWRSPVLDLDDFTASETDGEAESEYAEEEDEEDQEVGEGLADSFLSAAPDGESEGSVEGGEDLGDSMMEEYEDADEEEGFADSEEEEEEAEEEAEEEGLSKEQSRMLTKDYGAEIITGVKHLSMEEQ
ncbi:related to SMP2 protein [Cephalotrichum gorgonifer]|uniref:Related to SMP2 protein n=1 Tax=Cephalotrichum gorgonifer TaxID=2041049 RepID=A0AAE8SV12_9PEZI|nr:related to SMP2 protein [Cephalotrichum gorgonifer]